MLEVTEKALEKFKEFFETRKAVEPLRVMVAGIGWGGPTLGLALDEPTETDEVIETRGFTYLIEKSLLEQAQPIRIDYISNAMGEGFIVTSGMAGKGDCSGCTGC